MYKRSMSIHAISWRYAHAWVLIRLTNQATTLLLNRCLEKSRSHYHHFSCQTTTLWIMQGSQSYVFSMYIYEFIISLKSKSNFICISFKNVTIDRIGYVTKTTAEIMHIVVRKIRQWKPDCCDSDNSNDTAKKSS